MSAMRVLIARVRGLFGRGHIDADLNEEIRAHLDLLAAAHMRRGLSTDEAHLAARRDFGAIEPMTDAYRDRRAFRWLADAGQDLRFGVRLLPRHPGFAAGIILTLALGIGMVTAVFTVFNAVVLRPLPMPQADRLVRISTTGASAGPQFVFGPDFVDWRSQTRVFDRMVAYGTGDQTLLAPRGAARVRVADVTEDFWDLAGARPSIGRVPRAGERNELVVSHAAALRQFGAEAVALGKVVTLDGGPMTIVGVLPAGFQFALPLGGGYIARRAADVDVYRPMIVSAARDGRTALVAVAARLRPDANLEQGLAELSALRARSARQQPNPMSDARVLTIRPLKEAVVGSARTSLWLMMLAVACVLLIACANATNLLLVRASARWREIATRSAIGAGRGRMIRQLVTESLVLTSIAALLGVVFARAIVGLIVSAFGESAPRLAESSIDLTVLAAVAAVTVVAAVVCSIAPAFSVRGRAPIEALKEQSATASASLAGVWTRQLLVAAQCGLTLVLLAAGGLMLKSVVQMRQYPAGFEPDRVLTMSVEFAGAEYEDGKRQVALAQGVLDRLAAQPGVEAVSLSTHGHLLSALLDVENRPMPSQPEKFLTMMAMREPILMTATSSQLPRVLGLRMVSGRWLTDTEDAVVVNEALARREFPNEDPIGHRVRLSLNSGPWLTIVGVVSDLKFSKLDASVQPELFFPYLSQSEALFGFTALVRTAGSTDSLVPVMRRVVSEVDRKQVGDDVMTLEDALGDSIAPRRLNLFLLGTFAFTSLALALVGIFSVLSYAVAQRRQEIGVRLALGASHRQVIRMIVRQGVQTIVPGMVVGAIVAFALRRLMATLLYGVEPTDLETFSLVTGLLATTALLACYVAARRVLQIDSRSALHHD
jgi:putative ABC transport system permease protein